MIEMHPTDFTNDPYLAAQNDKLMSINATLQIDLLGQCGSESLGPLPYSGTGGQVDFVRAANRSRDGKSFIVLPSTARDDSLTRIVPILTPGTHVTTSKNDINYVVMEFGVAQLRGNSGLLQLCHGLRLDSGECDGEHNVIHQCTTRQVIHRFAQALQYRPDRHHVG